MLPLMDLFNHANADEANINMFRDENGDYYGYAKRPIAKGEQVGKLVHVVLFTPMPAQLHAAGLAVPRAAPICNAFACLQRTTRLP